MADAKLEAARIKVEVSNSIDQIAEKKRNETPQFNTVDDLAEDWLKECDKRLKQSNIPRRAKPKTLVLRLVN